MGWKDDPEVATAYQLLRAELYVWTKRTGVEVTVTVEEEGSAPRIFRSTSKPSSSSGEHNQSPSQINDEGA